MKTMRNLLILLNILLVAIMSTSPLLAEELAPHLHKTTLDNGLTVLVKEMPGTRVATVQIWVKAGSVYENADEAGITHFIEHMIFKGTETRGPGELAGAIEGVGGQVNAYTSYENTVYHATLSAVHWEMALEVLAEAVMHSVFDPVELEREKKVVLEELSMRYDRPNIRLFHDLMATAYTRHPYRLPVIGNEESINSFSRDKILEYISKHYYPQNLTVVVVGDVKGQDVIARVSDLMGNRPRGESETAPLVAEPVQDEARFFTIKADIMQPQIAIAIPISKFDSPDSPVLDVLAQIAGHGETSRLYRSLRDEKQLVYGINASAFTPTDPGMFEIMAVLDGSNMLQAFEASVAELFKFKYFSVTNVELKRAKHNLESDFVFNLERVEGQARVLGSFDMMTGDPREDEYLEKIRAVTHEDIKRVAQKYFTEKAINVGFLMETDSTFEPGREEIEATIARSEDAAIHGDSEAMLANTYLSGVHRFELENGITLLVREDDTVPTVGIRAVFPGGIRAETPVTNGAFSYISDLLPRGTLNMSANEIAEAVADMAGGITGFAGKNTFGIKADFLARFFPDGLNLVRDIIREPAFNATEAGKILPELLAQLKQQEDSLTSFAFQEFNGMMFEGHPYGLNSIGSADAIKSFTPAALKNIYQQHAQPDHLVLAISGDVKAEETKDLVVRLFGDWQVSQTSVEQEIEEEILPPSLLTKEKIQEISRDKEQVHLIIGFLGATLKDGDRFTLEILDTILSGQSGRLFTELRDKQSLAYSLSSFSFFGIDTGAFGIYIGTSPDKKEQAIKSVWHELNTMREEKVSEEELNRAKNILISQYELAMQTHSAQALDLGLNETYDLGQDFGNKYILAIKEIDAAKVLQAARKYILPDAYVMVAVGGGLADKAKEPEGSTTETSGEAGK
ncbi:MAG: insulinase family protein [Desulfobacterales bacterium]|nr:insulinase family protein [Desulfobacterales bacterium]